MSLQVTNNATPPDLNTATYIRVEISQPSVNGGTVISTRLTGCPIVSNSGTTSAYNCYTGYPDGYINGIAKFGYANFNYTAPSVPGSYTLTATCTNPLCANSQSATINVVCPAGTQLNAAGTACVEAFSLTLNAPPGDLEPSGTAAGDANSSKAMSVYVKSEKTGLAKSGAVVRVTLDAVAGSGGHLHNEPAPNVRPKGTLVKGALAKLDCTPTNGILGSYDCTTGADGYAKFTYFAPIASGTHAIIAACTTPICINNPQTAAVDVKVAGLSQISDSTLYALTEADGSVIGAKAGRHTDNHNMAPAAADALWRLAARYRFEGRFQQGAGTTPRILYLNDASLPWGGVYDISTAWQPSHLEHRRGTVVDVRANGATGAIPSGDIKLFFKRMLNEEVRMSGISFLHENPGTTNEHFHIRLQGRGE